jgi:EmrB/QacA subfamily drug resistance transporter
MSTISLHRESLAGSWHPAPKVWSSGEAHPRRKSILVVLCLSLLIVTIDNTVLNTALPTLSRSLHAGTSSLQWIVDAYVLCFAALLVTAGALGDRFGRRRALLAGLIVFAIGSIAASFATSAGVLIADRVIMGLGAAFVMPSTLSILNAVFPSNERPGAIGAWSAVAGIGIVLGPTLGGLLLAHFWWGSVFLVNVPLVLVALIAVDRIVPETIDGSVKRLDVVGTILIAGALVAIIDAIIEAPTRGWTSAATIAVFGAGLALMALFVRRELRIDNPLIDLRVFANRSFSAAAGAVTVLFFALFGSLFALTQYLQLVHGYSPLSAGLRALPFAIAMGIASPISTVAAKRLGTRTVITAGLVAMSGGLFALSFLHADTPYTSVAAFVALMGAGMGLVMAPASTTIMASVPAAQAGAGSAVNDTVREVGGALGVAVIGSLTAAVYGSHLGHQMTAHHAPAAVTSAATESVAAADVISQKIGGTTGSELVQAAHNAFVSGMSAGMRVAAGVALLGAVAAIVALPSRRQGGLATLSLAPAEAPTDVCDFELEEFCAVA